ncbi:hypothetical protein AHAS_Ahas17G0308600 [Arachis hypogaea]
METCATVEEILGKMNEQVDTLKEKNDNVSLASEVAKGTDGGDGTIDDDHNIRFIRMFQEIINQNEMTREVMKTLNEDIRTISGILVEHGKILQSLIAAVGPLADLKKEGVQGNARMVACRKTRAKVADEPEATLQKLTYKNQDSGSTEGSDVRQTEHGSPFTYHTHPAFHVASEMPQCLELAFRPPDGMHFQGSEFAVAAYIFSKNLDERYEILVADEHAQGDRRALWSLIPGQQVVDDVINMVASMLSFDNMSPKWFLPTTFAQIALSPVNHSIDTFEFIRSNFMGYADNLHRIYVPMYREQHWYLMIVDLVFRRLIYLDSAKNASEYEARIAQMKYVAFFIENMLQDTRFWSDKGHYKPHPSTFDLDEPEVGHQIEGSNDCGVWVVQWMMQSWVFRDFMLEDVTSQTRMRLALDLVMGRHNPIAREVGRRAMADWDRNMSRSKRRHNGNNTPADAGPSRSGSLTF